MDITCGSNFMAPLCSQCWYSGGHGKQQCFHQVGSLNQILQKLKKMHELNSENQSLQKPEIQTPPQKIHQQQQRQQLKQNNTQQVEQVLGKLEEIQSVVNQFRKELEVQKCVNSDVSEIFSKIQQVQDREVFEQCIKLLKKQMYVNENQELNFFTQEQLPIAKCNIQSIPQIMASLNELHRNSFQKQLAQLQNSNIENEDEKNEEDIEDQEYYKIGEAGIYQINQHLQGYKYRNNESDNFLKSVKTENVSSSEASSLDYKLQQQVFKQQDNLKENGEKLNSNQSQKEDNNEIDNSIQEKNQDQDQSEEEEINIEDSAENINSENQTNLQKEINLNNMEIEQKTNGQQQIVDIQQSNKDMQQNEDEKLKEIDQEKQGENYSETQLKDQNIQIQNGEQIKQNSRIGSEKKEYSQKKMSFQQQSEQIQDNQQKLNNITEGPNLEERKKEEYINLIKQRKIKSSEQNKQQIQNTEINNEEIEQENENQNPKNQESQMKKNKRGRKSKLEKEKELQDQEKEQDSNNQEPNLEKKYKKESYSQNKLEHEENSVNSKNNTKNNNINNDSAKKGKKSQKNSKLKEKESEKKNKVAQDLEGIQRSLSMVSNQSKEENEISTIKQKIKKAQRKQSESKVAEVTDCTELKNLYEQSKKYLKENANLDFTEINITFTKQKELKTITDLPNKLYKYISFIITNSNQLEYLTLNLNNIDMKNLAIRLASELPTSLKRLDLYLYKCNIHGKYEPNYFDELTQCFSKLQKLEKLWFDIGNNQGIPIEQFYNFLDNGLGKIKSLKVLDMIISNFKKPIRYDFFGEIAHKISKMKNIQELGFGYDDNSITDKGVQKLFETLTKKSTIKILELGFAMNQDLTDNCCNHIKKYIEKNQPDGFKLLLNNTGVDRLGKSILNSVKKKGYEFQFV
ncbi:hypothetical protein PPERSA_03055 [Pseudocohnilembus persalinus]|uniref:Uncharacterized protein n=1 Tax=Pseudocohnilembus persalinus TaxID=266149 RepID=A0A0V0R9N6_PSEPJ|nr:hypothetical protein PPERSA_03055 [Pseudocohnilembus persalinus]|eukprot:KRX10997.1 hypothetical protein PPERSA_03055 [Pseudocohnilembus persalinus]